MQKIIFQKITKILLPVLLVTAGFRIVSKTGVQPLLAVASFLLLRGFIRFVFRLTALALSIAVTIFLLVALLTCI